MYKNNQHRTPLKAVPNTSDKIRNIRGFVAAYLKSDSGKAALKRQPGVHKGQLIVRTPLFAEAFQQALSN